MKVNAVTEKAFQGQVLDLARLSGWLCYHTFDSRRSIPGFPDLVMVRPPVVLFAELKTERGRLRPEQRDWLAALGGCESVEAALWRPSDWREIEECSSGDEIHTRRCRGRGGDDGDGRRDRGDVEGINEEGPGEEATEALGGVVRVLLPDG